MVELNYGDWNTDTQASTDIDIQGDTFSLATAIPDSAIHQWKFAEGTGTSTADSIGSAGGTINGASWVSGVYVEDNALDFPNTTNHVSTTTLGSFGSNLGGTWAVSFTVEYTSQTNQRAFLGGDDGDVNTRFQIVNGSWFGSPSDTITMDVQNENNNNLSVATDNSYADGNKHRVVLNGHGTDASQVQIAVDGSFVSVSSYADGSIADSFQDFQRTFKLGSESAGDNGVDCTIDNPILYNSHLTSTQVQEDYNRQPWS